MTQFFSGTFPIFFSALFPTKVSPVTQLTKPSLNQNPRVFLLNTSSSAKWKFLGVIINYEGHSCSAVDHNYRFVLPYFTSILPLIPFYAASKNDSVIRFLPSFLDFVVFFFLSEF